MYAKGLGVEANEIESAKYYRLSAESGYAKAQYRLGRLYDKGTGVKQDYDKGAEWYKKSARQGNTRAQYVLGVHYAKGKGVKKNYMKAYTWLLLACDEENSIYRDILNKVKTRLTEQEYTNAVNRSREIRDQYHQ